ncbi:MAG: class IV adenylate cyclase [Planctomycetes bacterium]|nr:class IV adenylate cyclase [Planctomycetota bacterium]
MPEEIEIKLRVESHEPVRERLRSAGARPLDRVVETNTIFDRPDGWLRRQGCGLRLRTARGDDGQARPAFLTAKGPRAPGPVKRREEVEIPVSDACAAARLLELLGYVPVLRYEKRRESWEFCGCRVELDEPARIGLFVEIEGPDVGTIRAVQSELALDARPDVDASYIRLLSEHCASHHLDSCRDLCLER